MRTNIRPVVSTSGVPEIRHRIQCLIEQHRLIAVEERMKPTPDYDLVQRSTAAHDALRSILFEIEAIGRARFDD